MIKKFLVTSLICTNIFAVGKIADTNIAGADINGEEYTYSTLVSDEKSGMIDNSNIDYHNSKVVYNLPDNSDYIFDSIGRNGYIYTLSDYTKEYYDTCDDKSYMAYVACYKCIESYNDNVCKGANKNSGFAELKYSATSDFGQGINIEVKTGFDIENIVKFSLKSSASLMETETYSTDFSVTYNNHTDTIKHIKIDFKVAKYLVKIIVPIIHYPDGWEMFSSFGTAKQRFEGYRTYYYYTFDVYSTNYKLR